MKKKMSIWIGAIRLKTLSAILVPIAFGTASCASGNEISKTKLFAILCFGISIQVLTNLVNDRCDFLKGTDNDSRKGPMRAMQSKLITLHEMNIAIAMLTLIALTSGFYLFMLGGMYIAYLVIISITLAYMYTAGRLALAYLGLGDIFVLVFFGPIASGTTAYLLSGAHMPQAYALGLIPGLISTSILVANNLRDYTNDMQAMKKTLVVRYGTVFGELEYFSLLILAIALHLYLFRNYSAYEHFIPPITILLFIITIIAKKMTKKEEHLKKLLPMTSAMLTVYGISSLIFWFEA